MLHNPVHYVDVFAQDRYTGNQLAVVRDASALDAAEMLAFTRETNFSEAAFVESEEPVDGAYPVRIFDPAEELPFAGHPTLGAAHVVREHVADDRPDELVLDLGVGRIPVWVEREHDEAVYWMQQIEPDFGDELPPALLAAVLGLAEADLDAEHPVQVVSTGLPTVVVPLASLDAVRRADTQLDAYYDRLIDVHGNLNVLVFTDETEEPGNDLHARVFADCAGVPEDPATGSSNGCLAAYLARHDYVDADPVDATVEQGYEMDRPSRLHLRAEETRDGIDVEVGGRVEPVLDGRLR